MQEHARASWQEGPAGGEPGAGPRLCGRRLLPLPRAQGGPHPQRASHGQPQDNVSLTTCFTHFHRVCSIKASGLLRFQNLCDIKSFEIQNLLVPHKGQNVHLEGRHIYATSNPPQKMI